MWTRDDTGSVLDETGRVIWFSTERFVRDIAMGDCCFICGISRSAAEFNDEHVLPFWLLKRYDLFARRVTLPNGESVRYDRYTLPCCKACNYLMGEEVETAISGIFQKGTSAVYEELTSRGSLRFFVWLGLIFLKTHLKDRFLSFHLDRRKGEEAIADDYDWETLHHIHAVVRCFYTGSLIAREVRGSFICLPMGPHPAEESFDWADLYAAQAMMMRLGDLGFITVFNDSTGALSFLQHKLGRINGPLNSLQLRELMAEAASLNLHMKRRPIFRSEFDPVAEKHRIVADLPKLELEEWDPTVKGRLLHHSLRSVRPYPQLPKLSAQEAEEAIKSGKLTFLFDDDGQFIALDRAYVKSEPDET